jgi:hypothetical protein
VFISVYSWLILENKAKQSQFKSCATPREKREEKRMSAELLKGAKVPSLPVAMICNRQTQLRGGGYE